MQTIVCIFLLFTVSVAKDGDIFIYYNLENYENNLPPTTSITETHPFEFGYHSTETLNMRVALKNKPDSVTAALQLIYPDGVNMVQETDNYFIIHCGLKEFNMSIRLELRRQTSNSINTCNVKSIVRAYTTQDNSKYYDICLRSEPCVVEVDLSNNECSVPNKYVNTYLTSTDRATTPKGVINEKRTNERIKEVGMSDKISTKSDTKNKVAKPSEPSHSKVLVFVIPSVIVLCIIILVVYMWVKKRYHRNSQPEGTIELNTYATTNEILYADLSLEQGNNPIPRPDESPYAQIIGVMKPVPCKLRNK